MRIIETFNKDWTFRAGFEPAFASASQPGETVHIDLERTPYVVFRADGRRLASHAAA